MRFAAGTHAVIMEGQLIFNPAKNDRKTLYRTGKDIIIKV
jgi:hypothetical protein